MTKAPVYVNDKPFGAGGELTLLRLLRLAGRDPAQTVVTVDGRFVPRAEYAALVPPAGARVAVREMQDGG